MSNCSWIGKLIGEITYLSYGSISAAIFEYTFPTICKMWPNKINTYQLKKERKCKIENVNNFSLRLKIEMIIFIICHQMYYTDFYYISLNILY